MIATKGKRRYKSRTLKGGWNNVMLYVCGKFAGNNWLLTPAKDWLSLSIGASIVCSCSQGREGVLLATVELDSLGVGISKDAWRAWESNPPLWRGCYFCCWMASLLQICQGAHLFVNPLGFHLISVATRSAALKVYCFTINLVGYGLGWWWDLLEIMQPCCSCGFFGSGRSWQETQNGAKWGSKAGKMLDITPRCLFISLRLGQVGRAAEEIGELRLWLVAEPPGHHLLT